MLVSRWWFLGVLAVAALAVAAPQQDEVQQSYALQQPDEHDQDADRIDLDHLEDDDEFLIDEGDFSRGIGKNVGKAVISAGKKVIKISGKGLKALGKGAGKGIKILGKGAGKGLIKIAKGAGKGLIKGAKLSGKGLIKITKATKKFATKKGKQIWGGLKKHLHGELGQAGKKLLKAVGKQVLEVGVTIAAEAIAPMILEYAMQATQDGLCSCENYTCSCCAQPPGFEKGCLVVRVRPKLKFINAAVTYDGKELARINITSEEGAESCKKLGGPARFITACISPLGLGEIENGFRGCLNINLQPITIEREMCVDFTGTFKNGAVKWVPVNELDEVELIVEEAEE